MCKSWGWAMKLPVLPSGISLKISQADGIVGGKIWPAASALCRHLAEHQPLLSLQDKLDCIELGSGTGFAGIYAAGLGFRMTLTEHKPPLVAAIPSVPYNPDGTMDTELTGQEDGYNKSPPRKSDRLLQLLKTNVNQNRMAFLGKQPKVMELDWANPEHAKRVAMSSRNSEGFDLILASDVTYLSELHDGLLNTVITLLRKPLQNTFYPPTVFVAHQERVVNLRGQDIQQLNFEELAQQSGLKFYQKHNRVVQDENGKMHSVCILEMRHSSSLFDSDGNCLYR